MGEEQVRGKFACGVKEKIGVEGYGGRHSGNLWNVFAGSRPAAFRPEGSGLTELQRIDFHHPIYLNHNVIFSSKEM